MEIFDLTGSGKKATINLEPIVPLKKSVFLHEEERKIARSYPFLSNLQVKKKALELWKNLGPEKKSKPGKRKIDKDVAKPDLPISGLKIRKRKPAVKCSDIVNIAKSPVAKLEMSATPAVESDKCLPGVIIPIPSSKCTSKSINSSQALGVNGVNFLKTPKSKLSGRRGHKSFQTPGLSTVKRSGALKKAFDGTRATSTPIPIQKHLSFDEKELEQSKQIVSSNKDESTEGSSEKKAPNSSKSSIEKSLTNVESGKPTKKKSVLDGNYWLVVCTSRHDRATRKAIVTESDKSTSMRGFSVSKNSKATLKKTLKQNDKAKISTPSKSVRKAEKRKGSAQVAPVSEKKRKVSAKKARTARKDKLKAKTVDAHNEALRSAKNSLKKIASQNSKARKSKPGKPRKTSVKAGTPSGLTKNASILGASRSLKKKASLVGRKSVSNLSVKIFKSGNKKMNTGLRKISDSSKKSFKSGVGSKRRNAKKEPVKSRATSSKKGAKTPTSKGDTAAMKRQVSKPKKTATQKKEVSTLKRQKAKASKKSKSETTNVSKAKKRNSKASKHTLKAQEAKMSKDKQRLSYSSLKSTSIKRKVITKSAASQSQSAKKATRNKVIKKSNKARASRQASQSIEKNDGGGRKRKGPGIISGKSEKGRPSSPKMNKASNSGINNTFDSLESATHKKLEAPSVTGLVTISGSEIVKKKKARPKKNKLVEAFSSPHKLKKSKQPDVVPNSETPNLTEVASTPDSKIVGKKKGRPKKNDPRYRLDPSEAFSKFIETTPTYNIHASPRKRTKKMLKQAESDSDDDDDFCPVIIRNASANKFQTIIPSAINRENLSKKPKISKQSGDAIKKKEVRRKQILKTKPSVRGRAKKMGEVKNFEAVSANALNVELKKPLLDLSLLNSNPPTTLPQNEAEVKGESDTSSELDNSDTSSLSNNLIADVAREECENLTQSDPFVENIRTEIANKHLFPAMSPVEETTVNDTEKPADFSDDDNSPSIANVVDKYPNENSVLQSNVCDELVSQSEVPVSAQWKLALDDSNEKLDQIYDDLDSEVTVNSTLNHNALEDNHLEIDDCKQQAARDNDIIKKGLKDNVAKVLNNNNNEEQITPPVEQRALECCTAESTSLTEKDIIEFLDQAVEEIDSNSPFGKPLQDGNNVPHIENQLNDC